MTYKLTWQLLQSWLVSCNSASLKLMNCGNDHDLHFIFYKIEIIYEDSYCSKFALLFSRVILKMIVLKTFLPKIIIFLLSIYLFEE